MKQEQPIKAEVKDEIKSPEKIMKEYEGFDFDEAFTDHELEHIWNAMFQYGRQYTSKATVSGKEVMSKEEILAKAFSGKIESGFRPVISTELLQAMEEYAQQFISPATVSNDSVSNGDAASQSWVKASDKTPKDSHSLHWRDEKTKNKITSQVAVRMMANGFKHEVEYLEETPSSIQEQK